MKISSLPGLFIKISICTPVKTTLVSSKGVFFPSLCLLSWQYEGWKQVQWNHSKSLRVSELFAFRFPKRLHHHWSGRRPVRLDHCQLPDGKLPGGETFVSLNYSNIHLLYSMSHGSRYISVFAENPVEHICAPWRCTDCRVHGPRRGFDTDRLCDPGEPHRAWLLACAAVRLPVQRLHAQFPLLRQKRGL